jgi:hypothetical protein
MAAALTPGQLAQRAYEATLPGTQAAADCAAARVGPDTLAWMAADAYAKSLGYASAAEHYAALGIRR